MNLASRVRSARQLLGLSATQLDDLAGLSRGHVSRIERGERRALSIQTVLALARALRVKPGWLLQ